MSCRGNDNYVTIEDDRGRRRHNRRLREEIKQELLSELRVSIPSQQTVAPCPVQQIIPYVQQSVPVIQQEVQSISQSISDNGVLQTYQLTFNGAVNLRNLSGQPYVIFHIINYLNHVILQYEPFKFTLGTERGYVELNHNLANVPNHEVDYPTRLRARGNQNISYSKILSVLQQCRPSCNKSCCSYGQTNMCGNNINPSQLVGRLRIYISNTNDYRQRIGDEIEASGHSIQWIKTPPTCQYSSLQVPVQYIS